MKKLNVAILKIDNGHTHYIIESILANDDMNVVAVSLSPESVHTFYSYFGNRFDKIPIYDNDEDVFKYHKNIDFALLGGTNKEHYSQFTLCIEHGVHMLSMKVPTLDEKEYAEICRGLEEKKLCCAIELEMRWHCEVLRVKDLVKSGAIGKVLSFNAYNYSHFPTWVHWMTDPESSYGKIVPIKRGEKRYRGGALTDHPHIFDLIRFIFDCDVKRVYADVAPNMRKEQCVEDMIYIIGEMENGVIFSLDPSYANKEKHDVVVAMDEDFSKFPRPVEVGLSVHGEKGSIIADVYGSDALSFALKGSEDFKIWEAHPAFDDDRLAMMKRLTAMIRGEIPDTTREFFKNYGNVMKFINRAYESVASGEIIEV